MSITIKDLESAYAAGLFDGEGEFIAQVYTLYGNVTNTNRECLEFLLSRWGGRIGECKTLPGRKRCYRWHVRRDEAIRFFEDISFYLIIKQHRVQEGLERIRAYASCEAQL